MLSETLQTFVNDWRLGHIATVGPSGPNVSPKGTFQTLDAERIAFAEIRSPNTKRNLAHDPRVEVNMVDVFSRKGARFRGRASFHEMGSDFAHDCSPRWKALFGEELMLRAHGYVLIELTQVRPLVTPAYDIGATERALREDYLARFTAMQAAWLGAET